MVIETPRRYLGFLMGFKREFCVDSMDYYSRRGASGAVQSTHSKHLPPDRFELFAPARVTAAERERILGLIEARIRTRKPAAYLLGRIYAAGVPFYVDERVIVPRSYLGEIIAGDAFSGAEDGFALADPDGVARVLDLCTGSGALAVLAAMRFADAAVDAVDISTDALAVAARNVGEYGLDDRITLLRGDLFAPVEGERYDLIITNPPWMKPAWRRCRRNAGTSRRSPSTVAPTGSPSSRASSARPAAI
jgi:ribosomal protein L3 glutamine methyltransferase